MDKLALGWFLGIPVILSLLLCIIVGGPGLGALAFKDFEAVVMLF